MMAKIAVPDLDGSTTESASTAQTLYSTRVRRLAQNCGLRSNQKAIMPSLDDSAPL